jgi:hypothetical protein
MTTLRDIEEALKGVVDSGIPATVSCDDLYALGLFPPVTLMEQRERGNRLEELVQRFGLDYSGPFSGAEAVDEYYILQPKKTG